MLSPVDYALWVVGSLLEAIALVCAIRARAFKRYFTLVFYLAASLALGLGRYWILTNFGYSSHQYLYFFYYSDALLTICLYFTLMGLYGHVFRDLGASKYVRLGGMLLLAGTALISYLMVANSDAKGYLVTRAIVELSQNLYFVGVLLTYVLWGAMMKSKENRTRLMQLVLALGIYFSAYAASYALRNLHPQWDVWRFVVHLMSDWLPISWAYTFLKVPEDARLATARLAAPR